MRQPDYLGWFQSLHFAGGINTAVAPDKGSVDLAWNLGPVQEIGYYESALPPESY